MQSERNARAVVSIEIQYLGFSTGTVLVWVGLNDTVPAPTDTAFVLQSCCCETRAYHQQIDTAMIWYY